MNQLHPIARWTLALEAFAGARPALLAAIVRETKNPEPSGTQCIDAMYTLPQEVVDAAYIIDVLMAHAEVAEAA